MDVPEGLRARPATIADVGAITDLLVRRSIEVIGVPDSDEDEVRSLLTAPERVLERETLVLEGDAGALIGFIDVAFGTEHPAYRHVMVEVDGRHAGGPVHRWALAAAARLGETCEAERDAPRPVDVASWADDPPTTAALEALGYRQVRRFDLMERSLEPRPAAPSWPAGVTVRAIADAADLAQAHDVLAEAFEEHDGGGFPTFERFLHDLESTGYAPALSTVAWLDGRAVGAVIVSDVFPEAEATAYVNDLGVRREARGRGLGLALLLDAFGRMADAGLRGAALHVDTASVTGATRLYARAGMTAVPRYARWRRADA